LTKTTFFGEELDLEEEAANLSKPKPVLSQENF
jgi:hypothetical protein